MIKHSITLCVASVLLGGAFTASAQEAADRAQLVKRGEYLARAGDCIACHTAKNGQPFAGGLPMHTPIGVVYSSNITPDRQHGIGAYSLEDFDRAVRHGVGRNGESLYPAMPYPSYAKVAPADIKALYAYFMYGVKPVAQADKGVDIPWPLSMRWPLALWRKAFAPDVAGDNAAGSAAGDGDRVARGRYLVEGLGHCGTCHTPRNATLNEKSLTDDGATFLSGATIDNYLAKNLRGDTVDGLGRWSEADIVAFLKGGRNDHSAAFGGMAEVVENSTQHLDDRDLGAIAAYLKTLKPVDAGQKALVYDDTVAKALRHGEANGNGARVFLDNCAACHRTTGLGYRQTFPELALSSVVNTEVPTSLIHIVLRGAQMPWTTSAPTHYAMPGFEDRLRDQDIADVLTFVRSSWGNHAAPVTVSQVAKVRKALEPATAQEKQVDDADRKISPLGK